MDKISSSARSRNMSRIRSKDTSPEILLRKELFKAGLRFRLHTALPGKPDIVFKKSRTVVFVNGCFWHGHNCKVSHTPKSNIAFWEEKIARNRNRDKEVIKKLRADGWRVKVIWECHIRQNLGLTALHLSKFLSQSA